MEDKPKNIIDKKKWFKKYRSSNYSTYMKKAQANLKHLNLTQNQNCQTIW